MAINPPRRFRPLLALAAIGATVAVAPAIASAAPQAAPHAAPHATPHREPSVASVQKQLGELALKNDQLVEKFDRAQVAVQNRQKQASAAQVASQRANAAYETARARFAQAIQAQYESGSLGAAGALLDSSSGTNYLERISTLNLVSTHLAAVVDNVTATREAAKQSLLTAEQLLTSARHERDALAQQRKSVQAQIDKYRNLLATLTAAQRAAYQQQANPSVSTASLTHLTQASSAAAQRAVQFALDQVGKPYVFGAAGPDAFDCSGLTMAAWQRGGVSLPHSAADQYNYGHHVSRDALQPGDLIFFYQPIGHVTIYIGDGMMVSAPTEGENVSVVPLSQFDSDFSGATRLT